MNKENSSFALDRKIPLAFLFALLVQAATAVWWISAKETQDHFRDGRMQTIEQKLARADDGHVDVVERLARLETHAEEQAQILRRIETLLSKK